MIERGKQVVERANDEIFAHLDTEDRALLFRLALRALEASAADEQPLPTGF
ncbi:hypothetical protein [Amycolatopsis sp. NBC_01480]|uniref:hypothetical protein n=1 Tax=Amycolatopsis sp. NBC_01480 TaxID=2903562 RepID=UPI002E2E2EB4|nr:hypothetical protein [Amycolatopsis sp. NBC_01480]